MSSQKDNFEYAEPFVEELLVKEERLRDFAEAGSDWFFELDKELRFSYVSHQLEDVIGVATDKLLGKRRSDFGKSNLLPSEAKLFVENTALMLARQNWKDFTFTFVTDDGEHRTLRTSGKAIFDTNGEFAGYRGIGSDDTDRVRSENRLKSLAEIVDQSVNEIYVSDATTYRVLEANQASRNNLGYSSDEMNQLAPWDFVQGLNRENIEELIEPLRDGTKDCQIFEIEHIRKDGSTYPVRTQLQFMGAQTPPVFVAIVEDITELAETEAEKNRFARIVEDTVNEVIIFNADTFELLYANTASANNLGYSLKELQAMPAREFTVELIDGKAAELVAPLRSREREFVTLETIHKRKDGSTYPVETQIQIMHDQNPPILVAIVQDTTERKTQSDALKLRDRAIAEISTGILITDATQDDNPIIYTNAAMARITGFTEQDMLGRNPRFLQGDDRDQPELDKIRSAIEDAVPVHETLRNYRKDGTRFINEVTISPVRDDKGQVTHFIGVQSDITEKLETEERLRQSQKMEAIGQLTGGIAHDFNNLLTVVIGNNELLADQLGDDEVSKGLLGDATAAAQSGANLTGQLLSFARQGPLDPKSLDLNSLVEEMSDMLERTLGETVSLCKKLTADLGKTLTDPVQMQNALLNLAINARDAMPDGGNLTIETKDMVLDADMAAERFEVDPGRYARLCVTDTGVGMSPDIQARVMEPFFTTKEQGKGTGLGLSMVHGFAKQSGGHLEIYSEPGHGTSVSLYLPIVDDRAEKDKGVDVGKNTVGAGDETVLVVEDDARVRKITVKRLKHLDYDVIEAEAGQQALDILAKSTKIDIVFTDMVMPGGMTGAELLEKVRAKYPTIRRMITSGYAEDGAIPADGTPWLRKPYSLQDMAIAFRDLMDGSN